MIATAPAVALPLLPYLETEEEGGDANESAQVVVLPLPPDRSPLRHVEVWLSVATADGGRAVEQDHVVFDRHTTGDALRFYLPALPIGTYEATLRVFALIDTIDANGTQGVREFEDRASLRVEVHRGAPAPVEETVRVEFFFPRGQDRPASAFDSEQAIRRVLFILGRNRVKSAQIDCWASTEGPRQLNFRLTERRCAWLKAELEHHVPAPRPSLAVIPHGADDPPEREPAAAVPAELEEARRKNRVAVLTLILSDTTAEP